MKYKLLIADDEPITRMDIREMLEGAGYNVVGEASDGFDAVELCRKHHPDLVVMDIKMPLLNGLKASQIIKDEKLAGGVLLLTAYSGDEFVHGAKEAGVAGYLVKPVREETLFPMIEIALAQCSEKSRLEEDVKKAKDKLEERKVLERAKGILMEQEKISEEQAHGKIRKLSMDKRCSMKDIAKIIILNK